MYGNGVRIGIRTATTDCLILIHKAHYLARLVFFAAGRGSATRTAAARRVAAGSRPTVAARTAGFVWCAWIFSNPFHFYPFYSFWGAGAKPLLDRKFEMVQELKIISDFYDFMLWLIKHTEKFPKHHRYSLGLTMENRLQFVLGLLLRAKYAKEKTIILGDVNIELEILRFQLRLAKDLKVLPVKSHGYATQSLCSIGSQIGGWLKNRRDGL